MITPNPVPFISKWYDFLPIQRSGLPALGTLLGALVVLDHLRNSYTPDVTAYLAPGGSQIRGHHRARVRRILNQFDQQISLPVEAGRTNLGVVPQMSRLLNLLEPLHLASLTPESRHAVVTEMQKCLICEKLRHYPHSHSISFRFTQQDTSWQVIANVFKAARSVDKETGLAQHLVASALALGFPELEITEYRQSSDELPTSIRMGRTVFCIATDALAIIHGNYHVLLEEGYRVYLLVPDRLFIGAKQNVDMLAPGRIAVQSLETFISTSLDRWMAFSADPNEYIEGLRLFLNTYNRRVEAIETDKSLLIEIPRNLAK